MEYDFKLDECRYTPSISTVRIEGDKKNNFWSSDSYFRYNAALISYFYGKEHYNYRKYFDYSEDFYLMADSGAIQFINSNKPMEPERVFNWMNRNTNCGLVCDYIPGKVQTGNYEKKAFDECMTLSKSNYLVARKKRDFKLYTCIHGNNFSDLDRWYKNTSEGLEFDGIALPVSANLDIITTLLCWSLTKRKEYKNYHFLTGSGIQSIALIFYTKTLFPFFTFDSSSPYIKARRYAEFDLPFFLKSMAIGNKKNDIKIKSPCNCPVCKKTPFEEFTKSAGRDGKFGGNKLALHNLYNFLSFTKLLSSFADDRDFYKSFIKLCIPNVFPYIEKIDNFLKGKEITTQRSVNEW